MKMQEFNTPMMQQYINIKKKYPDCLLFFRMGDFYELFLEDAEIGSQVMDITLTARGKGKDGKIPMCGVPYHALDTYLGQVIKEGYKAAICEQISEPTKGKEIVARDVVRIVTPGTILDEGLLEHKTNNFILTIRQNSNSWTFAYADISTGEFYVMPTVDLTSGIEKLNPNEVVLNTKSYKNHKLLTTLKQSGIRNISNTKIPVRKHNDALQNLKDFFNVKTLRIFNIRETDEDTIITASQLIDYLKYTQKGQLFHIKSIQKQETSKYMKIDAETLRNLEIFHSNRMIGTNLKGGSLIDTIDKTSTSMGGRLLKTWIMHPLVSDTDIKSRQRAVKKFIENHTMRDNVGQELKRVLDIERLLSKLGTNTANARDLIAIKSSLQITIQIINIIKKDRTLLKNVYDDNTKLSEYIKGLEKVILNVDSKIMPEPPVSIREGGLIQDGVDSELDEIKASIRESKEWIAALEDKERISTGISSLKVGFNSVFGYYIEVSKSNIKLVPTHYVRKQTLVNSERYITEELKHREDIVLSAEEKINEIEYRLFQEVIKDVVSFAKEIQGVAQIIAKIDCLHAFAVLAIDHNYTQPKVYKKSHFNIKLSEARHPVVETVLDTGAFTPNSTDLNKKKFVHLITGPNMAGKSTYIRQIALIQLLAQIGSYVPADFAEVSIVDGIYTRVGAGDALSQGLSTFMVEMVETAKILHNATDGSLVILDEVGRGTSTVDGLSIARAVIEHIHNKVGAKTLFATHFHELILLEQRLKKLANFHVSATTEEGTGNLRFLHKLKKGGTDKSYGIEVAKLAGIPQEVIERAKEILEQNSEEQLKLDL